MFQSIQSTFYKQNCKVVPQVNFADPPPPSPHVVPGTFFGTFLFLNPSPTTLLNSQVLSVIET